MCGNHGTPLHAASYKGHLDAASLLLSHGVDVNTTNELKRTALCSAYDDGHRDIMRLFPEHGAEMDVHCDFAELLLH
ncbi:ankyrin repeat-containing domain protein, partial [Russula aff. rugulosa BPL654]